MFSPFNPAFDLNGLVVWTEEEIARRQYLKSFLAHRVQQALLATNQPPQPTNPSGRSAGRVR